MPDQLWPLFRDNPALLRTLPGLASDAITGYARVTRGIKVGVMAVLHTFTPQLEFNAHVHTMVTSGGLQTASASWAPSSYLDQDVLRRRWQRGVILLLRTALRAGNLKTKMTDDEVECLLAAKEICWWSVKVQSFRDKEHFLRYAGRYVRRPPIAQWRIKTIKAGEVDFLYQNKRSGRLETKHCPIEQFIERWAQHIPQRYSHAMRHFGLFAPRTSAQTSRAVFAILGQSPPPCSRISWAFSIRRDFGRDPLLDAAGNRMKWGGGWHRTSGSPERTHYDLIPNICTTALLGPPYLLSPLSHTPGPHRPPDTHVRGGAQAPPVHRTRYMLTRSSDIVIMEPNGLLFFLYVKLDVLMNNAGIMLYKNLKAPAADLIELTTELNVNVAGVIQMISAFIDVLTANKGTVINTSSLFAFVPMPSAPIYSATKAAIHSYTQSLLFQLEETGVEVIELMPPWG